MGFLSTSTIGFAVSPDIPLRTPAPAYDSAGTSPERKYQTPTEHKRPRRGAIDVRMSNDKVPHEGGTPWGGHGLGSNSLVDVRSGTVLCALYCVDSCYVVFVRECPQCIVVYVAP